LGKKSFTTLTKFLSTDIEILLPAMIKKVKLILSSIWILLKAFQRSIHDLFVSKLWFLAVIILFGTLVLLAYFDLGISDCLLYRNGEHIKALENLIFNFVTLFGVYIAIGAIIFSIIQSRKDDEDVIGIIFKESFIYPIVWFSILSLIFLTLTIQFQSNPELTSNVQARFLVLGNIFFITNLVLVGVLLKRINTLVKSGFLFKKYIENLLLIAKNSSAYNSAEIEEVKDRLEKKFRKSLLENNIKESDELFNVYKMFYKINKESNFIDALWLNIRNLNEDLTKMNNIESQRILYHYFYQILKLMFSSFDEKNIKKFANLSFYFYKSSHSKNFHTLEIIRSLSESYYYILTIEYEQKFSAISAGEKDRLNNCAYYLLESYSDMLRLMISYNDLESTKIIMEYLSKIDEYSYYENTQLYYEKEMFLYDKNHSEDQKLFDSKFAFLLRESFLNTNIYIMKIGLRAWVIRKYLENKITSSETQLFLEQLVINPDDSGWNTLIMFYALQNYSKMFGWDDWEMADHDWEEGVFQGDGTIIWINNGIISEIIRYNLISSLEREIIWRILKDESVIRLFENQLTVFQKEKEKFSSLYSITLEEYELRLAKLIEILNKRRIEIKKTEIFTIAISRLSEKKINSFIRHQGLEWERFNIENVFEYYKNVETIPEGGIQIRPIVIAVNYVGGKEYFLDGYSEKVYSAFEISRKITEGTNFDFFETLNNLCPSQDNPLRNNIVDAAESSILKLREKNYVGDIIFCPSTLALTDEALIKSPYFRKEKVVNAEKYGYWLIGYYKDIPIFKTTTPWLKNRICVASFNSLISIKDKRNAEWYKGKLAIEIVEITKEKAIEIFEKDPSKWSVVDGLTVDKDTAIQNISNGVNITVYRIILFQTLNTDALECCEIKRDAPIV
jgi:hypothetical protein